MSIVARRPQDPILTAHTISPDLSNEKVVSIDMQSIPSRTSSISSYKTNYTVSTSPTTVYSPSSPSSSCRQFDSIGSAAECVLPVQRRVPQEVYDVILLNLESLHKSPLQTAARHATYATCMLFGNDSPAQLKKYRLKRGSRLKLLRRTLRERHMLAHLVRELRVPRWSCLTATKQSSPVAVEYRDLVASVVMVAPIWSACWVSPFPTTTREAAEVAERSPRSTTCPSSLGPSQMFEFLNYHVSWTYLETLMLYGLNGNDALEPSIFLRMFDLLPALRHLCIASFSEDAFADKSLPGVTDRGLVQFTSRPESRALKSLVLVDQNVESLLVISKILSSLTALQRFKFVQTETCPVMPDRDMVLQPILASPSLRYLHWDVACPDPGTALTQLDSRPFQHPLKQSNTPNSHLAQSILSAGFPCLETLRAPNDVEPPGVLQASCRPITRGQALLQPDRLSLPRSSHGSVSTRPLALPSGNNLTSSRIRAQTFIDMAAKDSDSGMPVLIQDFSDDYIPDNAGASQFDDDSEEEMDDFGIWAAAKRYRNTPPKNSGPKTVYEFHMPAFMGRSGLKDPATGASIPKFLLRPDIPGQESDGGLVGWKHLLASNQSLSFAAGNGAQCFDPQKNSPSSPPMDDFTSPSSITSRFAWGVWAVDPAARPRRRPLQSLQ
ncbi:hypothetical protein POX_e06666 [Penicillium oxalicum]|uniref:hypothetical protein n=1 Tax=Penicillium oxalicum TaxID=69781 RepID=UPI0020B69BAB|nr:hypothetical protein POX_e06666 [Penicillium oxalicum]KAI2788645.1 hypothetical protein POX_e06666 [Penicillium oxalicum]